ncbi:Lar family restriction alleviation protein [Massilia sp. ZL223]|uniref:Lar family restriction alleviation protein n=1 Tax=Massilia sp. ZL223 TaxID=2824904 RepID=UPI001B824E9D|nr:Lar family restriction alleviation protein [Massilia sp. ZL223]MBQ5963187.1 Lar family restriction alleviation protein [Massilia sp. ZL223]
MTHPTTTATGSDAVDLDNLLPCPFCGSANISAGEVLAMDAAGETVKQSVCMDCGACGPGAALDEGEIDYGDVKSSAAWNRRALIAQARAAAPTVTAAKVETEMAERLRRIVACHGDKAVGVHTNLLTQAADECDRFYNGMMAWKRTAQAKDREFAEARAAAPAPTAQAIPEGYKLVPLTATPAMLEAARNAPMPMVMLDSISARMDLEAQTRYAAMLRAAPVIGASAAPTDENMTAEQARAALLAMPLEQVVGMVQGCASTATGEPWVPYLSDRADGVAGHYAIARWNPAGYREVWNLFHHEWSAFSDAVLTHDRACELLRDVVIPTAAPAPQQAPLTDDAIERAALKHVATDWHRISHLIPNYRSTEQFARLKAFALELSASAVTATTEQDAARYRWLCEHGHERMPEAMLEAMDGAYVKGQVLPKSTIDDFIDRAAMAATKEKKQ